MLKWCRSGMCVLKTALFEKYTMAVKQPVAESTLEKSNLIDARKFGDLVKSEHNLNRLSLVSSTKNQQKNKNIVLVSIKIPQTICFRIDEDINVERMG